ncbi:Phox homologous domain-containing protein, partial [Paraphysoderma sedebokerense]
PKCVIKALSDYHSSSPVELSFKKGDFFHVIKDDNDTWFEVEDPVKNMKGMVPVKFFEVIGRTHRVSTDDIDSQIKSLSIGEAPSNSSKSNGRKPQPLYAVVQYDFDAERKDELTAKVGDPIIVVARSNEEWFLAKPIGRLGGPGLIPVSYVQIRDPTTGLVVNDIEEAIKKHNIPHIEEWKKMNQQYTENIIPLAVPSYERRDSFKYLFVVHATRSDHSRQILYRTYDEFYDLQLTLLSQFPKESGRTGEPRIIPFMPGLVEDVTEAVTAQRRIDLDAYLKDLIKLPSHIAESTPVLDFFRIRTGD